MRAPLAITFQDDLSTGLGCKFSAAAAEVFSEFKKIVDLPVEHDHVAVVRAHHGLIAGREVNDGQASVSQEGMSFHPFAARVRPTMGERFERAPGGLDFDDRSFLQNRDKSTHVSERKGSDGAREQLEKPRN